MDWKERMYSSLIVSSAESFTSSLQALLSPYIFAPICVANGAASARRTLLERSFDFIFINAPLPDDTGIDLAIDLCQENNQLAVVFVKAQLYPGIYRKASAHGVYLLSKPTSKTLTLQALDWLITTRQRLDPLQKKNVSLQEKMLEIRLVNRANWMLIDQL